jgi:hypothetical protein
MIKLSSFLKGISSAALLGLGISSAHAADFDPPPGAGPEIARIKTFRGPYQQGIVTIHKANGVVGAGGIEYVDRAWGKVVLYEQREVTQRGVVVLPDRAPTVNVTVEAQPAAQHQLTPVSDREPTVIYYINHLHINH